MIISLLVMGLQKKKFSVLKYVNNKTIADQSLRLWIMLCQMVSEL